MTAREAYYVIRNRHLFTLETYSYALEIVEAYERQGGEPL